VFGSVARGEAEPDSDVDFLVHFDEEASLLDQAGLIQDLHRRRPCVSLDRLPARVVRVSTDQVRSLPRQPATASQASRHKDGEECLPQTVFN